MSKDFREEPGLLPEDSSCLLPHLSRSAPLRVGAAAAAILILTHTHTHTHLTVQVVLWRLGGEPVTKWTRSIGRHGCDLEAVLAAFLQTCRDRRSAGHVMVAGHEKGPGVFACSSEQKPQLSLQFWAN